MNSVTPLLPLLIFTAYFIGNFSPGFLLTKLLGHGDVRTQGSGGTGATNAGRMLGRGGFWLVFALDIAKGLLAVLLPTLAAAIAPNLFGGDAFAESPLRLFTISLACGLSAVAGHVWPALLEFRGGKGIAPFFGVWLAIPFVAFPTFWFASFSLLTAIVIGVFFLPLKKGAFLSALCALPLHPFTLCILVGSWKPFAPAFAMTLVLLFAHRENFRRRRDKMEQSSAENTLQKQ